MIPSPILSWADCDKVGDEDDPAQVRYLHPGEQVYLPRLFHRDSKRRTIDQKNHCVALLTNGTINANQMPLVEDLGIGDESDVIPVPDVNSAIMTDSNAYNEALPIDLRGYDISMGDPMD